MNNEISIIINKFASGSRNVLRGAFWQKTKTIAENLTILGRPVKPNSVWKMTETPKDVTRRNIIEQVCIFLGACYMESAKTFELVWFYLEAFALALRGKSRDFRSLGEAVNEVSFDAAAVQRAFFKGELEKKPELLIQLDQSLKSLFAYLHIKI